MTPEGKVIDAGEWRRRQDDWLPSEDDRNYVVSLMDRPIIEPGEFASWIAPPDRGINQLPVDHPYVKMGQ